MQGREGAASDRESVPPWQVVVQPRKPYSCGVSLHGWHFVNSADSTALVLAPCRRIPPITYCFKGKKSQGEKERCVVVQYGGLQIFHHQHPQAVPPHPLQFRGTCRLGELLLACNSLCVHLWPGLGFLKLYCTEADPSPSFAAPTMPLGTA